MDLKLLVTQNAGKIYLLLFVHHLYVIFEYFRIIDHINNSTDAAISKVKKYGARYYTIWNFTLQIIYLFISLLVHFLGKNNKDLRKLLTKIKGYMFVTLVGPCAVFTLTFFWTVYIIDRELVCPKVFDTIFPSYLKHATHTTTFLIFIVEMIIANHFLPKLKEAFIGFTAFHTLYNITLFGTYLYTSEWVYKLFEVLSWSSRIYLIIYENISSLVIMLLIFRYERQQKEIKHLQ